MTTFVIVVGLIVLILGGSTLLTAGTGSMKELRGLVLDWAMRRGLDPALVWGVVMTESSGDPNAVNPSDPSTGLMGVTPLIGRAYADLKGTDVEVLELLKNLATNMMAGTGFLAHLKFRYGGTLSADVWVQAYNLGETKFDRGARVPDYGERVRKAALTWALGTPI